MRSAVITALTFVAAFALSAATPACQGPCLNAFDCGAGAYCSAGSCKSDCVTAADCPAPACDARLESCARRFATCDPLGRCGYAGGGRGDPALPDVVSGFDAPPAMGPAFIVDHLGIADEGQGVNLDGACRSGNSDCIDNALAPLGRLANTQIQQGVMGGESLLLMELAGIDQPFRGNEESLTVKLYAARDADDPVRPYNNFAAQDGEGCCAFTARHASLNADRTQALSRAPARIFRNRLSLLAPTGLEVVLAVGSAPHPSLALKRALIVGDVSTPLDRISGGEISAAIPSASLARVPNPYCQALSDLCPRRIMGTSSLLDLVVTYFQPDIDLSVPRDGLDRLSAGATGRVDECRDGGGGLVPPLDPQRPDSCVEHPGFDDGFSVTLTFTAVAAQIVGFSD